MKIVIAGEAGSVRGAGFRAFGGCGSGDVDREMWIRRCGFGDVDREMLIEGTRDRDRMRIG